MEILRRYIKDETVDLVYLDPPFKSNQDYNVLFTEKDTRAAAQIKAFDGTVPIPMPWVRMLKRQDDFLS